MAIANVLSIGTTSANSSDVVVEAAAVGSFGLKKTGGGELSRGALVKIYRKDDVGGYNFVGRLNGSQPFITLPEGTYRFSRAAGPSVGVFSG